MCSRFEMESGTGELVVRFKLSEPPPALPEPIRRPTDPALVVEGRRRPLLLHFGIPAPWDGQPLINARAETLSQRQTFRPLLSSRCLVPATAYFEWRRQGRYKLKNRIFPADGGVFAFAGLWSGGHFAIVTCPPATEIAHIHTRMPVILEAGAEETWLDPSVPFAEAAPLLVPYRSGKLTADEEAPPAGRPDLFDS